MICETFNKKFMVKNKPKKYKLHKMKNLFEFLHNQKKKDQITKIMQIQ